MDSSQYITVRAVPGYGSWIQVDNFAISKTPDLVGLSSYAGDNAVKVYPNPVSDQLLVLLNNTKDLTKLELYNNLNVPVLQNISESQSQNLDVSHLSEGVYFLRISTAKTSSCKKIIIAR
jgi:hypothetical protein